MGILNEKPSTPRRIRGLTPTHFTGGHRRGAMTRRLQPAPFPYISPIRKNTSGSNCDLLSLENREAGTRSQERTSRMYQPGGFLDSQTTDSQIDFHTNEPLSEFQEIMTKDKDSDVDITLINDDDKELESVDTKKMLDEIAMSGLEGHADLETQDYDGSDIFTEESQEPFYDHVAASVYEQLQASEEQDRNVLGRYTLVELVQLKETFDARMERDDEFAEVQCLKTKIQELEAECRKLRYDMAEAEVREQNAILEEKKTRAAFQKLVSSL